MQELVNGRYDQAYLIPDGEFFTLNRYQIMDLLNNSVLDDFLKYSEQKIQYILTLFDLKEFFEIVNLEDYSIFYKQIKFISEEDLLYLISINKLNGIEQCKYVLNNKDYVKKIICSGYYDLFNFLSISDIDEEILDIIDCNEILNSNKKGNLSMLLQCDQVFSFFSKKLSGDIRILKQIGEENVTRKMVLFCMLDGMKYNADYDFMKYYKRKLDDIEYALRCGYTHSDSTIDLEADEAELFIDYGQVNVIDDYPDEYFYFGFNDAVDIAKKLVSNGHKYDYNLRKFIYDCYDSLDEGVDDLLDYAYEENNLAFCDSVLIFLDRYSSDDFNYHLNRSNKLSQIYEKDLAIQQYLKYAENVSNFLELKSKNDIYEYFNENGPTAKLYEMALFNSDLFDFFKYNGGFLEYYSNDKAITNYILLKKRINSRFYIYTIKSIQEINEYFDEFGFKEKLAEKFLFDINIRYYIEDFPQMYEKLNAKQKSYYTFLRSINFNSYFDLSNEEINEYFDESGFNEKIAEKFLFNLSLREYIKDFPQIYEKLTTKQKSYYEFLKIIKFNDDFNLSDEEINEYFGDKKINNKGIKYFFNNYNIINVTNNIYFKNFFDENYNISAFKLLLNKFDNNYYYLLKFLLCTSNFLLPLTENDSFLVNKLYCFNLLSSEKMLEIIKYIFYSNDNSQKRLSEIIKNNEFEILIKIFISISSDQNILDLLSMVNNFSEYKELCINMYNESELSEKERMNLYNILINGDEFAKGIINNRVDLNNYGKIHCKVIKFLMKNYQTISDINGIKDMIFKYLLNIDLNTVEKILDKYSEDSHFTVLKSNINDELLINKLEEYDVIINFINTIYKSRSLDMLNKLANKILENYENDNFQVFFNIWNNFSNIDSEIMKICGSEINEKITIFSELLSTPEDDIPMINGEKSFKVTSVSVNDDFEYDNIMISRGTKVKMIELNGLPFVSLGHVLNAFGRGGKLSDFNHSRIIGRTHLCLTAIDDNYYELVQREENGIDYVQVLFDNLPAESLVIASKQDAGSGTSSNELHVYSKYFGSYEPIRKVITETYHGEGGFNEYVYYRQYSTDMNQLKPSAVLIRHDEPTESEIQAAAYLNVPLVKINKEKYPTITKEEMEIRDAKLRPFYRNLYEQRNKKKPIISFDELKRLREQLMSLCMLEEEKNGKKVLY